MNRKMRAFAAGAVGAILAFGLAELVHGIYDLVPSVFLAIAQRIIELTPGGFATQAIETLGTADIPVLIASTVVGSLVVAGLLGVLSLRSRLAALLGVVGLGAIALVAAFTEPFIAPIPAILTILGALGLGAWFADYLVRMSDLRAETPAKGEAAPAQDAPGAGETRDAPIMNVRHREAHSTRGIAVPRKNFLALGGAAAVVGLTAAGTGRALSGGGGEETAAAGPIQVGGKGGAALHETLPPPPAAASIDVPGMPPLMTPNDEFYLIDTVLSSPRINVDRWKLNVKGAVENPVSFTYKDLLDMPTRESDVTLSCVSNEVGGGLVSNARWTGVLLSDVLKEAGVSRENIGRASEQLIGRSADGWTGGFKTEIALDGRDALVAFGMNDSELPVKHGYPVRLVVPGIYGYVSATKWLTEIELTDWDYDAYWIQRTWTKEGPVKTQSRIDTVKDGDRPQAGRIPIGGVAWAPHKGIDKVEVSTDDGETWNEARLAAQLDPDTWRQYVYDWDAEPGEHTIKVRATDGEGETQTEEPTPPHPSGATGYHTIRVTVA
ncbi:molybdopterin-dependent oxidoreductase [Rubrobacter marinus]|uniref:Molybdopterin-dependent oxidoreductase n=1 Tax=Rubrobacter marinus TaxID=2653852 RepID=A0A6G8Q178_9ACTN|nr:molybdopterin-dependent oxidoreductase [Rubrobacter marinus]QIN80067.1 molybdopterin-dependent oxidoreductase [Rubrobacter marinus]